MSTPIRILSIDDTDENLQKQLRRSLSTSWEVECVNSIETGLERLRSKHFDILLLDRHLNKSEQNGIDFIPTLKFEFPLLSIIILTYDTDFNGVPQAFNTGASEYLVKTDHIIEELQIRIPEILKRQQKEVLTNLLNKSFSEQSIYPLIGTSRYIIDLNAYIRSIKGSNLNVFIFGEHGTGKKTIAKAIWEIENDPLRPWRKLNIQNLSPEQLESELFCISKNRPIQKELDSSLSIPGDLILENISEIPLITQQKLEKFLHDRKISIKNSKITLPVNARIIATSTKSIQELIKNNKIIKSLIEILSNITIKTLPLKNRDQDIIHFINFKLGKIRSRSLSISEDVISFLKHQSWEGNIRQLNYYLEQAIQKVINENKEKITLLDFQSHLISNHYLQTVSLPNKKSDITKNSYQNEIFQVEKNYIQKSLDICNWNIIEASNLLGLSRSALYKKINLLKIFPIKESVLR